MSEFNQVLKRILKNHLPTELSEQIEFEICNEFAGEKVYVSQPFELRNKRIIEFAKTGHNIASIAQFFNITEKSVKQIIKNWS